MNDWLKEIMDNSLGFAEEQILWTYHILENFKVIAKKV